MEEGKKIGSDSIMNTVPPPPPPPPLPCWELVRKKWHMWQSLCEFFFQILFAPAKRRFLLCFSLFVPLVTTLVYVGIGLSCFTLAALTNTNLKPILVRLFERLSYHNIYSAHSISRELTWIRRIGRPFPHLARQTPVNLRLRRSS